MAATYDCIATTTLGSDQADVTFSSISGNYTDIVVVCSARTTATGTQNALNMQFNSDTASNYSLVDLYGTSGSAAASEQYGNIAYADAGRIANSSSSSTRRGLNIIQVMNYSNTTTRKTILTRSAAMNETYRVYAAVSTWRSTSAITSIKLYPSSGNLASGSTFTLYGIKAA